MSISASVAGFARDLAAIAGIARVEIGEAADADRMMVASGQQRRARGRAHRGGVEAGVAQAFGREPIDGRRPDRRAVAAEIGKADVVEQHDQDIGSAGRRLQRRRPPRPGAGDGLADGAAKCRTRCLRSCVPSLCRRRRLIRRSSVACRGAWGRARRHHGPALPETIIRIIIMIILHRSATAGAARSGPSGLSRRDAVAAKAKPRDDGGAVAGRRRHAANAQPRRIVDRGAVRQGRRHRRRVLQPVREQGGLFQHADRTGRARRRAPAGGDDGKCVD